MTLDNMTGITKGSYTGFCKRQLITCNFVKACNGVCPFEDALKHADKEMDEQTVIDHDRDWIIGCIEHDGFIHTHRFDKANQIIHEALQTDLVRCKDCRWWEGSQETKHNNHLCKRALDQNVEYWTKADDYCSYGERREDGEE